MIIAKHNEFILSNIDRAAFEHIKLTFTFIGEDELPEDYYGNLKVRREVREENNQRNWYISFSVLDIEPGTVNWITIAEGMYATVNGDDAEVKRINTMRRKFQIFQAGVHALDFANYPNCSFLMLCRAAQIAHDKEIEIVNYMDNEAFTQCEDSHVEAMCIMPVAGAQHGNIRRTDHLVVSRKLEIGVDTDEELLCSWPIVICGNMLSFNQHIPGPVLSYGNLKRTADVMDINTKDIHWSCNEPMEVDYNPSTGCGTLEVFHTNRNSWVRYSVDPVAIRPVAALPKE